MPSDTRLALAEQWSERARAEHEAGARFAGLAQRLRARAAPSAICELADRAVADEARHFLACTDEARRWSDRGQAEPLPLPCSIIRIAPPRTGDSPEQRLQFEIVTLCCVAETINCIYLSELLRHIQDYQLRERTRAILQDEVMHSRLGWLFLQRTGADLRWLAPHMPRILRSTIRAEVFSADSHHHAPELGLLDGAHLAPLFLESVEEVVLPGLADFGLPYSVSWTTSAVLAHETP